MRLEPPDLPSAVLCRPPFRRPAGPGGSAAGPQATSQLCASAREAAGQPKKKSGNGYANGKRARLPITGGNRLTWLRPRTVMADQTLTLTKRVRPFTRIAVVDRSLLIDR